MGTRLSGNRKRTCAQQAHGRSCYLVRRWRAMARCAVLMGMAALCVSACGGGGGAAPTASATSAAPVVTPAPVPAAPVARYAGTWYGNCTGRVQDTATVFVVASGANALQMQLVRNFHAIDGCAGTPIAAETLSADFTLSYTGSAVAAAILAPNTAAAQVSLDLVTIAIPAYTRNRSGAAATTGLANGVITWCINYPDGQACSAAPGTQAAASAPGALALDKDALVLLSPVTGGYVADARYTKVRATTTALAGPAFERIDTVPGTGLLASSGRTLTVHYTGWLYDATKPDFKGTTFDSSVGKKPFSLVLGAGSVIAGWDQGLPGMRVGGKRTLIIPSTLAYGHSGSGAAIPPDAALVFDIELISVQ